MQKTLAKGSKLKKDIIDSRMITKYKFYDFYLYAQDEIISMNYRKLVLIINTIKQAPNNIC